MKRMLSISFLSQQQYRLLQVCNIELFTNESENGSAGHMQRENMNFLETNTSSKENKSLLN